MISTPAISDQRSLVWRYIWSTALIAASVGAAALAARWTGLIG
jgi:hypothetical protein